VDWQDPSASGRLVAIRIRFLPKGTIVVEQNLPDKYVGTVEKEAGVTHSTPSMNCWTLHFVSFLDCHWSSLWDLLSTEKHTAMLTMHPNKS